MDGESRTLLSASPVPQQLCRAIAVREGESGGMCLSFSSPVSRPTPLAVMLVSCWVSALGPGMAPALGLGTVPLGAVAGGV